MEKVLGRTLPKRVVSVSLAALMIALTLGSVPAQARPGQGTLDQRLEAQKEFSSRIGGGKAAEFASKEAKRNAHAESLKKESLSIAATPATVKIKKHKTGMLATELAAKTTDPLSVVDLTIIGEALDAADFAYLRDEVCGWQATGAATGSLEYLDFYETATTQIPAWAFSSDIDHSGSSYNDTLETVITPDEVTSVGEGAFASCTEFSFMGSLDAFGLSSIGAYAFSNTSTTSLTFFGSDLSIAGNAFSACPNLTSVYFGGSLDDDGNIVPASYTLGDSVFAGCDALQYFVCESDIELTVENGTFTGVPAHTTALLPKEFDPWNAGGFWAPREIVYYEMNPATDVLYVPVGQAYEAGITFTDRTGQEVSPEDLGFAWFFAPFDGEEEGATFLDTQDPRYTIGPVGLSDAGYYEVMGGSEDSEIPFLDFWFELRPFEVTAPKTVTVGQKITASVNAEGGAWDTSDDSILKTGPATASTADEDVDAPTATQSYTALKPGTVTISYTIDGRASEAKVQVVAESVPTKPTETITTVGKKTVVGKAPVTGDRDPIVFFAMLAMISAGMLGAVVSERRMRSSNR